MNSPMNGNSDPTGINTKSSSTAHMGSDGLVARWSIKPADHKAVRVRNNQRRHRERARTRITDLESRLSEAQSELRQAHLTIEHLTRELEIAHASTSDKCTDITAQSLAQMGSAPCQETHEESVLSMEPTALAVIQPPICSHFDTMQSYADKDSRLACRSVDDTVDPSQFSAGAQKHHHEPIQDDQPPHLQESPGTPKMTKRDDSEDVMGDEKEYCGLQPPGPTESTTRCRDAFEIIAQQNYAQLELSIVRGLLQPGFRGPVARGDGCRVENQLLFGLLDYINSL